MRANTRADSRLHRKKNNMEFRQKSEESKTNLDRMEWTECQFIARSDSRLGADSGENTGGGEADWRRELAV